MFMKNLLIYRFYSRSAAEKLKNLNYENKSLFGPVRKKAKNEERLTEKSKSKSAVDDSERYWLFDQNPRKVKFVGSQDSNKYSKSSKEKQGSIEIKSLSDTLKEIGLKKVKKDFESTNTKGEENIIPFNTHELQNILRFPLNFKDNVKNLSFNTTTSVKIPSVGKILQATMPNSSREALIKWKLLKIAELGEEGFNNLQKELLNEGKLFHKALQEYLTAKKVPEISASIEGVWHSVVPAIELLQPETKLIEAHVEHPYLKYCGVVDYVSQIKSNISVVEWKKSNKQKKTIDSTYDAPVQLCAYLGALNVDSRYKLEANSGFVIVAYSDGQPAQIHHLDDMKIQNYWDLWLHRLQEYWIRVRDGTLPETI